MRVLKNLTLILWGILFFIESSLAMNMFSKIEVENPEKLIENIANKAYEKKLDLDEYFVNFCSFFIENKDRYQDIEVLVNQAILSTIPIYIEKNPNVFSNYDGDKRFYNIWYSMYFRFNTIAHQLGLWDYLYPDSDLSSKIYLDCLSKSSFTIN